MYLWWRTVPAVFDCLGKLQIWMTIYEAKARNLFLYCQLLIFQEADKIVFAELTGLDLKQINNWFTTPSFCAAPKIWPTTKDSTDTSTEADEYKEGIRIRATRGNATGSLWRAYSLLWWAAFRHPSMKTEDNRSTDYEEQEILVKHNMYQIEILKKKQYNRNSSSNWYLHWYKMYSNVLIRLNVNISHKVTVHPILLCKLPNSTPLTANYLVIAYNENYMQLTRYYGLCFFLL